MLGWFSLPAREASFRKSFSKRLASSSPMSASLLATLTATLRSLKGSSARYTSADAPCPSSERIVYLPIFWGRSGTFCEGIPRVMLLSAQFNRLGALTLAVLRDQRSGDGEEAQGRDVGHDHGRARLRVAVVAEERAAVGRIVMAREEVSHQRFPLPASQLRLPEIDALGAMQRAQALELFGKGFRVGHEMGVILEQERHAQALHRLQPEAARLAHALDQPVGHAQVADLLALGLHIDGTRRIEALERGPDRRLEGLLPGLRRIGKL